MAGIRNSSTPYFQSDIYAVSGQTAVVVKRPKLPHVDQGPRNETDLYAYAYAYSRRQICMRMRILEAYASIRIQHCSGGFCHVAS
jgi:hypothetical protein